MGVKNLWDILESCKKTLPLTHLQNKRVCVDLSCWMVQLQKVNKSHCPLKDKLYLKSLFHRLRALIALNCSLIFVTDGSIPAIKLSTYRRRLNAGNETIIDAANPRKALSVKRNMGSEFSCMIKEAKFLGVALGIPCLDGIEEAEAQCALLDSESLCDGCFTADSDAFLFGARTVYRDICLGEGGYVVCYEMDDIETKLGFGRNSLITLAILLGSDYNQGVRGFGPESACQLVKSIGDSAVLRRFATEGLSITKKKKISNKKGQNLMHDDKENNNGIKCDLPLENHFLQVINAYLKPKCHSADSDIVHRVLVLYPFSRSRLHQICAQFLDWSSEKTDEYILPKIAERNLRRFANLRSTSSVLGVHLPINEMPVKCPVSSIIKQRKVQGKDYFEVSWEDMDGLKTSVVPSDLVESGCPEKIVEFQQRKAEKKKPTHRSKPRKVDKGDNTKDIDIDRKLQELLLDIERDSGTMTNNNNNNNNVHVGMDYKKTPLNSESESKNRGSSSSFGHSSSSGSTSVGTDIIDLTSPPPRVHAREVSKCQVARCADVIDLSDTENDVSPEHARKARELRLFLANIRD
ncbi:flap endonuclease gen-like 2 [Phtheirospermum japonicum]|uniref:Single-strand DNA endonuclease 1 n=1 Tax=Phtheirospermum japonicum TaxID=374723 RepID=A0A830B8I9_9LAMI|nr:flap endonuclease gen-like 2 [Phtheirospermum japonicum]